MGELCPALALGFFLDVQAVGAAFFVTLHGDFEQLFGSWITSEPAAFPLNARRPRNAFNIINRRSISLN